MRLPASLPARWLRGLAEMSIRAVGPRAMLRSVAKTMAGAGHELEADGYYLLGLGKGAGIQVGAWLADMPKPRAHRSFLPKGYPAPGAAMAIRGTHPLPGPESFRAGQALLDWLDGLDPDLPLVILLSGGGSATVEAPREGIDPEAIMEASRWLLHSGLPIEVINPVRAQWSAIKGGLAAMRAGDRPLILVVQSDVPAGLEAWGSGGPFDPGPFPVDPRARTIWAERFPDQAWRDLDDPGHGGRHWQGLRILAGSNDTVLQTAAQLARREGLKAQIFSESLSGEAREVGARIAATARDSDADLLLFGGEPTVTLGPEPGHGGRLGELALGYGLADWDQPPWPLLAVATDGVDGASRGGGAWWLPGPWDPGLARAALEAHDADRFFTAQGWLLPGNASGINVRDVVMVLRRVDGLREPE